MNALSWEFSGAELHLQLASTTCKLHRVDAAGRSKKFSMPFFLKVVQMQRLAAEAKPEPEQGDTSAAFRLSSRLRGTLSCLSHKSG